MPIQRFLILAVLIPFSSLLGKYNLPPMEKSIEDESTGLNVPPGFEVDLVYQVDKKKYGSWIAMAFDDKGRLMALFCHNNDIADGWEREGENSEYFRLYSERVSYPLGINIVMYALSH